MKRKIMWTIGIGTLALVLVLGVMRYIKIQNSQSDPDRQIAEQIYRAESALKEMNKGYECHSVSKVTPFTYTDSEGKTIVYYCCQTAYVSNASGEYAGLNMDAIGMVIDFAQIENKRECKVNEYDAFQCEIDDRSYLCWTLTPKISCVIEYGAEDAYEAEILRMAESILLSVE